MSDDFNKEEAKCCTQIGGLSVEMPRESKQGVFYT